MKKLLFVDRDGTLVREPHDYLVNSLEKIRLVPDVIPALLRLKKAGYFFIIVSNQDGLGTETFPRPPFDLCHAFISDIFESQGITFESVLFCKHYLRDACGCRKPGTGLVQNYLEDTGWDRQASAMVGDRDTDMQFAVNMGIRGLRVDSPFAPALTWSDIADVLIGPE